MTTRSHGLHYAYAKKRLTPPLTNLGALTGASSQPSWSWFHPHDYAPVLTDFMNLESILSSGDKSVD